MTHDKQPVLIAEVLKDLDSVVGSQPDDARVRRVASAALGYEVDVLQEQRTMIVGEHTAGRLTSGEADAALIAITPALLDAQADRAELSKGGSS